MLPLFYCHLTVLGKSCTEQSYLVPRRCPDTGHSGLRKRAQLRMLWEEERILQAWCGGLNFG